MSAETADVLAAVLQRDEDALLGEWMRLQIAAFSSHTQKLSEHELREESRRFLTAFRAAVVEGPGVDVRSRQWETVRAVVDELSASRARRGFSSSETASFVFSLKQPVFARLRQDLAENAASLADETWRASVLLDNLGLYSTEVYQNGREAIIKQQQQELLELSTPVVSLWDGVLALPLIGTLDSSRTQVVMESLLQEIVRTGAPIAIIDITGVPTVDTLVAQHLLKTVAAERLMGADCIISGIRPQIAQTIVHLGVALGDVVTKASLADAFEIALKRVGYAVTRAAGA